MIQIDRRIFTHFDYILVLLIAPILSISFYLVNELYPALANRELIYFIAGFVVFVIMFLFPIRRFLWLIPLFYWFNIALLILVELFGVTKLGAKRWLEIPFFHLSLQPSELMKPALILMLGFLIYEKSPPSESGYGIKAFAKLSFYILLPAFLIYQEPDLGTALMVIFLGFGILFVIGVNYRIWVTILVLIALISPFVYSSLKDYQKKRIADFLSTKPSYHVRQSIIAIGSGGLYGKEKEHATQAHMKFLPIATSDFIFAFLVERFGFWGGVLLIAIYTLLILHFMMVTLYMKGDYLIQVVSTSLALLFFLYASVNIAMTMGYAPVVGIPLPLFSYGGSSFITFMVLMGIYEHLVAFRYKKYDSVLL